MKKLSVTLILLAGIYSVPSSAVIVDPDLTINTASLSPASVSAGESISTFWQVVNLGGGTLVSSWKDSVYLSMDSDFDSTDLLLFDTAHVGALAAAESYSVNRDFEIPLATSAGIYFLLVGTDTGSQVFESDETNNFAGVEFEVLAAAVPIPGAIWLFGTAIIGLVGFSKRRKGA